MRRARRLASFVRLPAADRALLIRALPLVLLVRLAITLLPFRLVLRLLSALPAGRTSLPPAASLPSGSGQAGTSVSSVRAPRLPRRPLRPWLTARAEHAPPAARADHICWAVSVAARYVPAATCLTQATAAYVLLTRAGLRCRLQIGVRRDDAGAFAAHAWVVYADHVVIGGRGHEAFTPIFTWPGRVHE